MTATSFNNPIDFEKDQQDAMKKTEGIQSLADQVERLELCDDRIADIENDLKMNEKRKETTYQER